MADQYSRATAVNAVRKYYTFLAATLGGIPGDSIIEPPVSGWRSISETSMSGLGKNSAVVDLLRHLPYIKTQYTTNEKIAPETRAIDYTDAYSQKMIAENKLEGLVDPPGAGVIPPHVTVLSEGAQYGSWLLLDTKAGTITDFIQQERPERDQPDRDSPDFWRAYHTLPIAQFFDEWMGKFRSLEWVVNPFNTDDGMMLRHDTDTDSVRQIYQQHGWPDNFQRADCHAALQAWHESH